MLDLNRNARFLFAPLVFLLAGAGACSGTVIGASSGGGGSGTTGCPAAQPAQGSSCSPDGLSCTYGGSSCGPGNEARCSGGAWTILPSDGPPCSCPPELPTGGSGCDPCCAEVCSYSDAGCGPSAQCSPSGTWTVTIPPCVPPPPEGCSAFTTPADCAAAGSCRWLVPGCMQMPPFPAGCYDLADCVPGTICASGQSCAKVDTDPCWDSNCNTCSGGVADICFGPG